jgi:uncharacterized membrane protein YphA (DoxX/SURF4 family)
MNTECCQQDICPECRSDTNWSWTVMRFAVAAILLMAAFFKAHDLTTPALDEGLFHVRWFKIFVVEFEIFFGLWLIFGFLPKLTRLAAIGCFSVFAFVSFYKALSGSNSCGCFGEFVTINPWIMTFFDLGVIALLLCCRLNNVYSPVFLQKILFAGFVWLCTVFLTSYFLFQPTTVSIDDIGSITETNKGKKTIVLMPKRWLGKDLPLIRYLKPKNADISIVSNLNSGTWTVILYHSNCPKCKRMLSNLAVKQIKNIVYVEVPLNGKTGKTNTDYDIQLDTEYNWFCQPPIVVQINNNIVKSVYTSEGQIDSFLASVQH